MRWELAIRLGHAAAMEAVDLMNRRVHGEGKALTAADKRSIRRDLDTALELLQHARDHCK